MTAEKLTPEKMAASLDAEFDKWSRVWDGKTAGQWAAAWLLASPEFAAHNAAVWSEGLEACCGASDLIDSGNPYEVRAS